jgi:hypothetical protein
LPTQVKGPQDDAGRIGMEPLFKNSQAVAGRWPVARQEAGLRGA